MLCPTLPVLAMGASTGVAVIGAGVALALAAPLFLVKAKSTVREEGRSIGTEGEAEAQTALSSEVFLASVRPAADPQTSRR